MSRFSRGLLWLCFLYTLSVPPILASVIFVDDLNFDSGLFRTGKNGNVTTLTESSSFYTVEDSFDVNDFHNNILKAEADKTGIISSNLVIAGFSLVCGTGVPEKPYIVATDTLHYNQKFSIIYESGFSNKPKDGKKKCVYASCGQKLKDEIRYPLEDIFTCIRSRMNYLPEPSQYYFKQWSEIQSRYSQQFQDRLALEKGFYTLDELKERSEKLYKEARQGIMEEGVGSVIDSEQIFLCHDSQENIIEKYFDALNTKILSYQAFLEETARKNYPFLEVKEFSFKPIHFGIHLYTKNEMCRFCGDSIVAKLLKLRDQYSIDLNIFVSYRDDIMPDSEERRPAGFSHLIGKGHDHYKILRTPAIEDGQIFTKDVFQKKL